MNPNQSELGLIQTEFSIRINLNESKLGLIRIKNLTRIGSDSFKLMPQIKLDWFLTVFYQTRYKTCFGLLRNKSDGFGMNFNPIQSESLFFQDFINFVFFWNLKDTLFQNYSNQFSWIWYKILKFWVYEERILCFRILETASLREVYSKGSFVISWWKGHDKSCRVQSKLMLPFPSGLSSLRLLIVFSFILFQSTFSSFSISLIFSFLSIMSFHSSRVLWTSKYAWG